MNKKTIAAILLGLGLSTAASAAVSHGNLTFQFAGFIPALTTHGTGWSFVNADETPYSAPASITLSATDTATGVQLVAASEEFYLKPDSGTFAAASQITALLTAQPVISGTAINPSALNTVATTITLNGTTIPVGANSAAVPIVTLTGASATPQRMTLGADVMVPSAARNNAGGDIRVTATIRMAADLT